MLRCVFTHLQLLVYRLNLSRKILIVIEDQGFD